MAGKRVLSTAEEKGIVTEYVCGVPVKDICEDYGISRMTVSRVLKRYAVDTNRRTSRGATT